jgi:hypothetical protein
MQLLAAMGGGEDGQSDRVTFGDDGEGWQVYRQMALVSFRRILFLFSFFNLTIISYHSIPYDMSIACGSHQ